MSKYILEVHDKEVSNWSPVSGMGSHVATYGIDLSIEIDTVGNDLTIDTIVMAINDLMDVNILSGNVNCCNAEFGSFDIIEDSNSLESINGDYISYYGFTITPKSKSLDLEQLFGGSK